MLALVCWRTSPIFESEVGLIFIKALYTEPENTKILQVWPMGGFNDKEHRYFAVVPDRAENVFSGLIRVGLYELDEISTVKEFLVFEIVKVEI